MEHDVYLTAKEAVIARGKVNAILDIASADVMLAEPLVRAWVRAV